MERRRPRQPEIAFVRALLFGAIADLYDTRAKAAGFRHLAREWIEGASALVTFASCCAALALDVAATREALLATAERGTAGGVR